MMTASHDKAIYCNSYRAPFCAMSSSGCREIGTAEVSRVIKGFHWNKNLPAEPLVSIIVTVYNKAPFLSQSLESLLAQTYGNIEIIIVDDGSTDGGREIIARYKERDSRITVIHNTENLGPGGSANVGIAASKGELLARLDADDISFPHRIELQVKEFQKDPDLIFCSGLSVEIDEDGRAGRTRGLAMEPDIFAGRQLAFNDVVHSTSMFRRLFLADESLLVYPRLRTAEDYGFFTAYILSGGRLRALSDVLGFWRVTAGGLTSGRKNEMDNNAASVAAFLQDNFPLEHAWARSAALMGLPAMLLSENPDKTMFLMRMLREIPHSEWRNLKMNKGDIWCLLKSSSSFRIPMTLHLLRYGSAEMRLLFAEYCMEFAMRRLGFNIGPQ